METSSQPPKLPHLPPWPARETAGGAENRLRVGGETREDSDTTQEGDVAQAR